MISRSALEMVIRHRIEIYHRGKSNAIKRKVLLEYCRDFIPNLRDRELRQIYSKLPILSCRKGLFWPIEEKELLEFRSYLVKKSSGLFNRWKIVSQVHKALINKKQMELFQ